jgi:hypothetical protein
MVQSMSAHPQGFLPLPSAQAEQLLLFLLLPLSVVCGFHHLSVLVAHSSHQGQCGYLQGLCTSLFAPHMCIIQEERGEKHIKMKRQPCYLGSNPDSATCYS